MVQEVLGPSRGLTTGVASSLASLTAASSMDELVDAGWALSGAVFSYWVVRDLSGRATLSKTALSGKKTKHFIGSLNSKTLPAKRHGWP